MNIAILEIQFEDNTIYFPSIHFYLKSYYQKFGKYNDRIVWKKIPFIKDPSAEFVNDFIKTENIEILMCSVYTWNNDQMIKLIAQVKRDNPTIKIVFGGPHVMTLFDKNGYFEKYDFIDVAILGDGETAVTEFLDNTIESKPNKKIIGVAYKDDIENSSYVPARCLKIDAVSPYLDLKDEFIERNRELDKFCLETNFIKKIVVDSNRGCPYRCIFCDWGSGTQNKVVKRTTETLFKELTLVLENKFDSLYFADANFGLYERDVDIIKFVADYKGKYGYPSKDVNVSFAKTDKAGDRILEIFKIGWKAGLFYTFRVDVQDFDQEVLDNIQRKNLSNAELSRMVREIEKDNIPIKTQGMLGLPGQTKEKIIKSYIALLKLNLSANGSDLFVSLPGSQISDPLYKEKYKLKTSHLAVDDGKAVSIRAITEEAFWELSGDKVPVMHPNRWQYQEYVTESYSFDRSEYADIICANKLMTIFEYNWMLKPLRVMHKKISIDPYEFYNDLFNNLDRIPTLAHCIEKGKQQTVKWLSGETNYMKIHKYEDPILDSFGFAMNFENYVITNLLIYKRKLLQELKNYYSTKDIAEHDLETALNIIDMMQIDDGIIEGHKRTFEIKGKKFLRKVDPKIHIYQTHDRPHRSMMLSTCYSLQRRLNVYQYYYCNGKEISLNDLNYFVDDFC